MNMTKKREKFWSESRFIYGKTLIKCNNPISQIIAKIEHKPPYQTLFKTTYSNVTSIFKWLSKLKFHSFMTKVSPNSGTETKSDIFPWDKFKSGIIHRKILKCSNDLIIEIFQFHCKSKQKQTKWNKIKQDLCKSCCTFLCLQVLRYFNDSSNLFLDKVYLKNEWWQFRRNNDHNWILFHKWEKKLGTFSREKITSRI